MAESQHANEPSLGKKLLRKAAPYLLVSVASAATTLGIEENVRHGQRDTKANVEAITATSTPISAPTPTDEKTADKELSPERFDDKWLGELKVRFEAMSRLHIGVAFNDVEKSLRADITTMRQLQAYDKNGHEMNVFDYDKKTNEFIFASAWTDYKKVSPSHRNIVLDKEAEDWLNANYPNEKCNGNAADIVKSMGGKLADRQLHEKLLVSLDAEQLKNFYGWNYLDTPANVRNDHSYSKAGDALYGFYDGVYRYYALNHFDLGSFRAALRVKKV